MPDISESDITLCQCCLPVTVIRHVERCKRYPSCLGVYALSLLIAAPGISFASDPIKTPIRVVTEELPPYNMAENEVSS